MTWCPGHPDFVIEPNGWGSAYADRYDPDYGRTVITPCTKLIVHHGASNAPSPGGEAAFTRQIEAYGESRDGAAVEYHYLVYPTGVVHGGFGDTRGCHASATDPATGSAYNSSSIGMCFVGYFHDPYYDQPTPEAIAAFQAWLSWMLDSGRLTADATVEAASNGAPGWYGHRDVFATACPGDTLYPQLPSIITPGAPPATTTPTPPTVIGDDTMPAYINKGTYATFAMTGGFCHWVPTAHDADVLGVPAPDANGFRGVHVSDEFLRNLILVGAFPEPAQGLWAGHFRAWWPDGIPDTAIVSSSASGASVDAASSPPR